MMGVGLEAELGRDIEVGAGALGEGVLPGQSLGDGRIGNVGINPPGWPATPILVMPYLSKRPGLKQSHGAVEFAQRDCRRRRQEPRSRSLPTSILAQRFSQPSRALGSGTDRAAKWGRGLESLGL